MMPDGFRGWRLSVPPKIFVGEPANVTRVDVILPLRLNLPSHKRSLRGRFIFDEYDLIDSESEAESGSSLGYSEESD